MNLNIISTLSLLNSQLFNFFDYWDISFWTYLPSLSCSSKWKTNHFKLIKYIHNIVYNFILFYFLFFTFFLSFTVRAFSSNMLNFLAFNISKCYFINLTTGLQYTLAILKVLFFLLAKNYSFFNSFLSLPFLSLYLLLFVAKNEILL